MSCTVTITPTCTSRAGSPRASPCTPSRAATAAIRRSSSPLDTRASTSASAAPWPRLTSERMASPGCDARVERTAATAAAAAVLAQCGAASPGCEVAAAAFTSRSKVTCLVAVYGSCLEQVAGTPRRSPSEPSMSYSRVAARTKPSCAYAGSLTIRMRVASAGASSSEASPPATMPAAIGPSVPPCSALKPAAASAALAEALSPSYAPNLRAPSAPYPTIVGPMPVSSAPRPSSRATRASPSSSDSPLYASTVCWRVLTTSMGVARACEMLAHSPPASR
mmetsp:Transcript_20192/g.52088  ORF Transcript_20192/g.52088 Transcript_20192/m.52088 type:complete len:279 (+) Transcript_20192:378-1214(+)